MNEDAAHEFSRVLSEALARNTFVRLVLGKAEPGGTFARFETVPTVHRGVERLTTVLSGGHRSITKHWSPQELVHEMQVRLGREFRSGTLETTTERMTIDYSRKGVARLSRQRGEQRVAALRPLEAVGPRLLDLNAPYLQRLGLVREKGKPSAEHAAKLRQVEKFLEFVRILLGEAGLTPSTAPLRVLDVGSGKSYLTFTLYDYLRSAGYSEATVVGVERRTELVRSSQALADECGFRGLSFFEGSIESFKAEQPDLVVALHACDTATDDALALAMQRKARAVMVAPCCQRYVRPRMTVPVDLRPIFRHPILEEHLAVDVTDGLRTLLLEAHGYHAKLFEFVGAEHTARNTMITGHGPTLSLRRRQEAAEEMREILATFSLADFYLDAKAPPRFS